MVYYLVPILINLLLIFGYVKNINKYSSRFIWVIASLCATIFCGGYMTGSDWIHYEIEYQDASWDGINDYTKEKGFYVFMLLIKTLGVSFFPFIILCKILVFGAIVRFLQKHSVNFYFSFFIFLTTNVLFLFIDNPLRFMLALGIIVCSYTYLLNRNFILYSLLIGIGALFHISSLIMLPIYFFGKLNIPRFWNLICYFSLFFIITPTFIFNVLDNFFPFITILIKSYYEKIGLLDFSYFSIGRVMYAILFILLIFGEEEVKTSSKLGRFYYAFAIIHLYLSLLGHVVPTMFRLSIFLAPFMCLVLPIILLTFRQKRILQFVFFSYFTFSTLSQIKSTYVYVPYTNYLFYMHENLPYEYRIEYNKIKFFEHTGEYPKYQFGNEE